MKYNVYLEDLPAIQIFSYPILFTMNMVAMNSIKLYIININIYNKYNIISINLFNIFYSIYLYIIFKYNNLNINKVIIFFKGNISKQISLKFRILNLYTIIYKLLNASSV